MDDPHYDIELIDGKISKVVRREVVRPSGGATLSIDDEVVAEIESFEISREVPASVLRERLTTVVTCRECGARKVWDREVPKCACGSVSWYNVPE